VFLKEVKMNLWFYISLILLGILTSGSIWAVILNVKRFLPLSRLMTLLGPIALLSMFIYSIDVLKDGNYSWFILFCLSLISTFACICAGGLLVGTLIILAVGGHWTFVTLRNTNYSALWRRIRRDFAYSWSRVRAWVEGEE
jgi:hypothetical protein